MHKKLCITLLLSLALLFAAALPSVAIGDSLLKQHRDEIKKIEPIEKYKERVRRIGDTLYLKTRSGKDAIFKDTPEDIYYIDLKTYQFMYYMPEHDLYFLRIFVYQADWIIMASGKTGAIAHIGDPPIISPDNKWLLTVLLGDDMTSDSAIYMWRINDGEFTQVLDHEPEDDIYRQYSFVRWQDDKTIIISKETPSKGKLCPNTNTMIVQVTLKHEKDSWRLYDDLQSEAVTCIQY